MAERGNYLSGPGYTRAAGFEPGRRDPGNQVPATPPQFRRDEPPVGIPAVQPQFRPAPRPVVRQPLSAPWPAPQATAYSRAEPAVQPWGKTGLTLAEGFWYVLMCIPMGAGYFAKIPAKRALQDFGLARMTAAESFWYVLMCIAFGGGYFAKIPVKKALSEMQQRP